MSTLPDEFRRRQIDLAAFEIARYRYNRDHYPYSEEFRKECDRHIEEYYRSLVALGLSDEEIEEEVKKQG